MNHPKGQILPGSPFGDLLTSIARRCETIVEIGTWRGQGSTLCIFNGLERPTQRFWTIEQDQAFWNEARRAYSDPRVRFINAHAVGVLDELPPQIDMVLFDGHDVQTDGEFDLLKPRLRIAALDDTREMKNRRQREMLLAEGWTVLGDNQTDRNGWSIFERP